MAIFRGVGGSGDSSDNSFLDEVTAQAQSAEASATAAANSATSALNTELTSASFNTSNGVLTLTKQDGDTVTTDLDGRFLLTESNDLSSSVTWANVPNANITQSSVTQHQAALSITESQISDLQSYLTSYTETDPVFSAHAASDVTSTKITNWDSAYNDKITAVNYSGSTLTLTQQDGGTLTTTIAVGGGTATGVDLADNVKATFGDSDDLQIYHDGSNSYVKDTGTGYLILGNSDAGTIIKNGSSQNLLTTTASEIRLGHQGDTKLATKSTGIDVTGTATMDGLTVDGNVGIGTINPTGKLHVYNGSSGAIVNSNADDLVIESATNAGISILGDGNETQYLMFGDAANSAVGRVLYDHNTNHMALWTNANERMRIDSSGHLLVGKTSTTFGTAGSVSYATGLLTATVDGNACVQLNRLTSDGVIQTFGKDGTTVGTIGTYSTDLTIGTTDVGVRFDDNASAYIPWNVSTNASTDATIDLGHSTVRYKDLYLSGRSYSDSASIGTTSTSYRLHVDAGTDTAGGAKISRTKSATDDNGILTLTNTSTEGAYSGYMLMLSQLSSASPNAEILRGGIGLTKNAGGNQFTSPYIFHESTATAGAGVKVTHSSYTPSSGLHPCTTDGSATSGTFNLGATFAKWSTVYATTGTINTSDRTEKQDIEALNDAETRVAVAVKGLLRKYRYIDAVAEKGNNARIHFGIIAQDLQAAFVAEGLDAGKYAMFCSDTWYEYEGEAYPTQEEAPEGATEVTKLGVRYSELLAFIISAI